MDRRATQRTFGLPAAAPNRHNEGVNMDFRPQYRDEAGNVTKLKRRERPEMLFGTDGEPSYFFTAVENENGESFSLVQQFRKKP